MNWDAIGAIAEIIGSFVVVISFLYLALQIRQSSKSARSASANQSRMAVTDVLSAISSDSETSKVYTTGMSTPDSLELHERVRFDLIIYQQIRVTETIFFEYQEGFVSEELWLGQWRGARSILSTRGGRESWNRQKEFISKSYMVWVDEHLDEN
jgi:hypothetical protein